jgi:predicted lactoylglutathione lyase
LNLPVRDLKASTAFYKALGATLNPQFSGEKSSCMMFSDTISVMLLTREHYSQFTQRPIGDPRRESQALLALSADSRDAVNATLAQASAAGGHADPNPAHSCSAAASKISTATSGRSCGWTPRRSPKSRKTRSQGTAEVDRKWRRKPLESHETDSKMAASEGAGVERCYGIVGDTLNQIAHAIDRSAIQWVHMRHEEAGAFAAGAEAQLTGRLTACAGSCGPGSLHFINGLYQANRNPAPVILIASQIVRQDLGFESIQEVDFVDVYRGCGVFCEMILTPEQVRRKTVAACQAALTRGGVAVLVVPVDVANAAAHDELPYTVHARRPLVRPSDADLDEIAAILNKSKAITIYAAAGCAGPRRSGRHGGAAQGANGAHVPWQGLRRVRQSIQCRDDRHHRRASRLSRRPRLRCAASARREFRLDPVLSG